MRAASKSTNGSTTYKSTCSRVLLKSYNQTRTSLVNDKNRPPVRTTAEMSKPIRPDAIELLDPDQLLVVWADGHESLYSHYLLRCECQCATCKNEITGERLLDPNTVPHDVRVSRWEYVGNYGIKLFFSDRHSTGIYTYKRLRNTCPCCQSNEQPRTTDAR